MRRRYTLFFKRWFSKSVLRSPVLRHCALKCFVAWCSRSLFWCTGSMVFIGTCESKVGLILLCFSLFWWQYGSDVHFDSVPDAFAYLDFWRHFAIIFDENLGVPKNRFFIFFWWVLCYIFCRFLKKFMNSIWHGQFWGPPGVMPWGVVLRASVLREFHETSRVRQRKTQVLLPRWFLWLILTLKVLFWQFWV